ncbi:MAG TPA: methyltransferase, partial [Mycobacteriales bacterium]|nr:methyltransferase [Mycobacteriales bacterium]
HFARDFEAFIVEPGHPAEQASYFDALYASAEDPWGLAERFYETRKRDLLLASLPRPRFHRAFEPGCATGLLTAGLAERCDELIAWDGAEAAVRQTHARLDGLPSVRIEQRRIPSDWPPGEFDLVVLSEVGYYCPDPTELATRVRNCLSRDGVVIACHWRHHANDHPQTARNVHDAIMATGLRALARHREADFLLDIWSRTGESVAQAEGILE